MVCSNFSKHKMTENQPEPKKQKYFTSFKNDWLFRLEYKDWLQKQDNFTATCKICNINFVIKHEGEKSIKSHAQSKKHKELISARNHSQLLTAFMVVKDSPEETKATIAELAMVYHSVKHQHSYASTDCGVKLYSKIYEDSSLSKFIHCGKTKAAAFVENILGPKSVEMVLEDLKPTNGNCRYFSISMDASNRGNEKLFPLVVTYFMPTTGIQNKLIDFFF